MRKTLSKMKFCAKTSRRGEKARAEAPEAEALAGCSRSSVPRASGLRPRPMVGAEEGLRRLRPQRGRPGRMGPAQARGPGEEGGTRGTGSGRDWAADVLAGSASHLPRARGRAGEKVLNGVGVRGDLRTGPSPPASHRNH